jgi:hypothetical protein
MLVGGAKSAKSISYEHAQEGELRIRTSKSLRES